MLSFLARGLMMISRRGLPFGLLAVSGWVLWPQLAAVNMGDIAAQWSQITPMQWVLAVVGTALSFFAISQYDVIAHRQLDTRVAPSRARSAGAGAIALSQFIGFGAVTATLVRWRKLSGFGPGVAALVTGFVSVLFLGSAIALCALMWLVLPTPGQFGVAAALVLATCAGVVALAVIRPRIRFRGRSFDMPSLRAVGAAATWASLDLIAASFALYVLMPLDMRPDLLAFLPVFTLAMLVGLYSGTPGGAGPFEITLLALTAPHMPAAMDPGPLLIAILAFRCVYFVLPGLCALAFIMRKSHGLTMWQDPPAPALFAAPRAETGVIRQNGGTISPLGSEHAALWPTGQALVALFDPLGQPGPVFFRELQLQARERNRTALLYKCSRDVALRARKAGWSCLHMADDAVLDLTRWSLDVPCRARLRRKLRQADKAGVTVRAMNRADWHAMAAIDKAWQDTNGAARGGTMGQYDPAYLGNQVVHVAEIKGKPVAFVSFHVTGGEWALDLMRQTGDAPQGTMHALVASVTELAARSGLPRLSLAALPACPDPASPVWRAISLKAVDYAGSHGLRQFKSSFAPEWQPLYAAAPGPVSLAIGLADVAREVFWPDRPATGSIATESTGSVVNLNLAHNQDENYEVASSSVA